jgi:hypothetical protein
VATSTPLTFWSGADLVNHTLPEVGFWVDHIVPKGGIVLLHGKYGSYKTPLAIHLAYCVAMGIPFLGIQTEQTKVLFVEGDTPMVGIWTRIQAMNPNTSNLDFAFVYPGFNVVQPTMGEHNRATCQSLSARCSEQQYGLVVVDSLRTSHMLPDKDSEVPSVVYGAFARLFPGATIFIIHHDRKTKVPDGKGYHQRNIEVDNESFSGSQAWIDRATTSLKILKGYGDSREWITLSQTKSQVGIEMDPIQIHITNGCNFSQASDMTDTDIKGALPTILTTAPKTRTALDKALAGYFQVTEKWACTRRTAYETLHGPILQHLVQKGKP